MTSWGSRGIDNGKFIGPAGLAVDSRGDVYVSDSTNHRMVVFSPAPSAKPINLEPTGGRSDVSLTPSLTASLFSGAGTHRASEWQVTETPGDLEVFLHSRHHQQLF